MTAQIINSGSQYEARFERMLKHSIEDVWNMFSDNEKLQMWFDELRVEELGKGGFLKFDMGDGTFEKMKIMDFKEKSVLEFTWGDDLARFEFHETNDGCQLVLIEKITQLIDHTPKDLAGWHVCLDVIEALLDGKDFGSREDSWKKWYEKYKNALKDIAQ